MSLLNFVANQERLWDEDTRAGRDVRAVVRGSAPVLISLGLTESMAGLFEMTRLGHWRFTEMRAAFGFTLDQFIFYGGYPGAASLMEGGFVVVSSNNYNANRRDIVIMAITSQVRRQFGFGEAMVADWQSAAPVANTGHERRPSSLYPGKVFTPYWAFLNR